MASIFTKAFRARVADFTITLLDTDGTESTISAGDVVRIKIGRTGDTPILDLDSAANSSNGSSVGSINPIELHIDQVDMALFSPGLYDLEIAIVDSSVGNKIVNVEMGVFLVLDSPDGDIGVV